MAEEIDEKGTAAGYSAHSTPPLSEIERSWVDNREICYEFSTHLILENPGVQKVLLLRSVSEGISEGLPHIYNFRLVCHLTLSAFSLRTKVCPTEPECESASSVAATDMMTKG